MYLSALLRCGGLSQRTFSEKALRNGLYNVKRSPFLPKTVHCTFYNVEVYNLEGIKVFSTTLSS